MYPSFEVPAAGHTLAALRERTAARHAEIEALLRLREPFGRAHYAQVLLGFDAFLRAWEPRIAQLLPAHLQAWFARGRRAALLQADLRVLGLQPPDDLPAVLPPLHTTAQALGSLYVLEGSALGGQFIAAHLRRHLGLQADSGAAYFHGAGAGTVARWREFQQLLARELDADADAGEAAVQAAVGTFDALLATFRVLLHERATA